MTIILFEIQNYPLTCQFNISFLSYIVDECENSFFSVWKDGNKYIIDANGNNIINADGIQTPDLRGRFILGSGSGNDLERRFLNQTGGAETVALVKEEMPRHSHQFGADRYNGGNADKLKIRGADGGYANTDIFANTLETGGQLKSDSTTEYETKPHENMPPFYVLTYIMKL